MALGSAFWTKRVHLGNQKMWSRSVWRSGNLWESLGNRWPGFDRDGSLLDGHRVDSKLLFVNRFFSELLQRVILRGQ